MTEVAEGIHRLTNGVSNFYLIEESGKLVLVDAGAPRDWHLLGRVVREFGRDLGDLDTVLLTHAHTDHTGFAEQARSTTGARVWVHEHDAQMARTGKLGPRDGKTSSYLLRAAFWRTVLVLSRRGGTKIIPIREVSEFSDGQTLDVPGKPRVVHAPGPHRRQRRDPAGGPGDLVHRGRAVHLQRLYRTDRRSCRRD
jgi:glyoxylase-like metal-dependent hydrolase (beta-lactamase superfamily II)